MTSWYLAGYVKIMQYNSCYVLENQMGDQLINIDDLGKQLKIPAKTIRNKLSNGTWPLPPIRIGRALRWRQSDVDCLISRETSQSSEGPRPEGAPRHGVAPPPSE